MSRRTIHQNALHSPLQKEEVYKCTIDGCNREFSCKRNLVDHTRGHHQGVKPHICDFPGCGKSFLRPAHLLIHIRIHTGEKPFVCEYPGCGKRWNQKSALKQHLRSHTGEKPFACSFPSCGKQFSTSSSCKRHILTHDKTNEQPESPINNNHHQYNHYFPSTPSTPSSFPSTPIISISPSTSNYNNNTTTPLINSPLKRKSSSLDGEGSGCESSPTSSPIFVGRSPATTNASFYVNSFSRSVSPSSGLSSPADSPISSPPSSPSRQLPPLFKTSLKLEEYSTNMPYYNQYYPSTKRFASPAGPLTIIPSTVISTTTSFSHNQKVEEDIKPKMALNFLLN